MPTSGTFLVTAADEDSAVLRDVERGQVHTLSTNPGLAVEEVVVATLAPEPPLEVTWTVESIDERRSVTVERSEERPDDRAFDAVAGADAGEVIQLDAPADGRHDVLAVPVDRTGEAATEVVDDEATLLRAARTGADCVIVRAADGVVSVRYR